jgi:type VI secretion system secreted protein VgrG
MKLFKNRVALGVLVAGSLIPLTFAAGAVAAQAPVPLGTTANFAVLGGTQITNVPTSVISGDVGLSPAAGSKITGLGCVEVTGTIYAVDASGAPCFINNPGLLTTAKTDLVAAFDNAAQQTPTQNITGVNLAGQTYGPGVFSSTTSILISGPTPLTLDGGGNADAVFIFQAAAGQNLVVDPTSSVRYTNGAQPCNVFWKVQSAFLANSGFGFVGTILALTAITATANITVEGRLLARNAEVTLISDTIKKPTTCVRQADTAAATAAATAEAARVEAERVAAVAAAQVATTKRIAAAKKVAATKAAAAKKVAATKKAAGVRAATTTGGSTSVSGPALPPVNTAGFTG